MNEKDGSREVTNISGPVDLAAQVRSPLYPKPVPSSYPSQYAAVTAPRPSPDPLAAPTTTIPFASTSPEADYDEVPTPLRPPPPHIVIHSSTNSTSSLASTMTTTTQIMGQARAGSRSLTDGPATAAAQPSAVELATMPPMPFASSSPQLRSVPAPRAPVIVPPPANMPPMPDDNHEAPSAAAAAAPEAETSFIPIAMMPPMPPTPNEHKIPRKQPPPRIATRGILPPPIPPIPEEHRHRNSQDSEDEDDDGFTPVTPCSPLLARKRSNNNYQGTTTTTTSPRSAGSLLSPLDALGIFPLGRSKKVQKQQQQLARARSRKADICDGTARGCSEWVDVTPVSASPHSAGAKSVSFQDDLEKVETAGSGSGSGKRKTLLEQVKSIYGWWDVPGILPRGLSVRKK